MLPHCLICNSEDVGEHLKANDYITKEEFTLYLCKKCHVGFTYPQPMNINLYYPTGYRRFTAPVKWLLKKFYNLRAKNWIRKLGSSGRVLEVGCGSGWMLKALHDQGWEVVGLERTEEEARFASSITGLRVISGTLEEIKSETYDLIILFNVLEHMTDPIDVLCQCRRLLKEKGTIILSMPNLSSLQARFNGPSWFHLDVPRHLFHFSRQSLTNAFEIAGFHITHLKYISLIHDVYGWVQSLLNILGFEQNRLTKGLMGDNRRLDLISPSGLIMVMIAILSVIPSVLLFLGSWVISSGAIIEIWAKKKD